MLVPEESFGVGASGPALKRYGKDGSHLSSLALQVKKAEDESE